MKTDKMINVCIIGGGNISNTRHIPALKRISNVNIIGVVSDNSERLLRICEQHSIEHSLLLNNSESDMKHLQECKWFSFVDAVVIGAPPEEHYHLAKMALTLNKHVLVEKPMAMNTDEIDNLIALAEKNMLVLNVVHNFNYSTGMKRINHIVDSGKYGDIVSINEFQFTNRNRRLPSWYNNLPMGLFFDEAPHFVYLLNKHGGSITIENVHASFNCDISDNTPNTLSVDAKAGNTPVHMFLNFNSPICEWNYLINFKRRIVVYDLFRDIVIDLPTDNEHLAKNVLLNDMSRTIQFWLGFFRSGSKMVRGKLLYGHETVVASFIDAIRTGVSDPLLSAECGRETVRIMNEIVEKVKEQ